MLVLRVGKGCRLIKHNDRGVLKNGSRKHDALHLAAGEISSFGTDERIESLRKSVEDLSALREVNSPVDLLECRVGRTVPDVFENGGLEEASILEDKGDTFHQFLRRHLPHVYTADQHPSSGSVPETRYQSRKGGLTTSRWSHEGNCLPLRDAEGDMADSVLLCALIAEGDILQRHAVPHRLQSRLYGRKWRRLRQSLQAADRLSAEEEVLRQIGAAHNTESDDRCDQDVEKHIRDYHHRISSVTDEDDCHRDEDESEGARQHRIE